MIVTLDWMKKREWVDKFQQTVEYYWAIWLSDSSISTNFKYKYWNYKNEQELESQDNYSGKLVTVGIVRRFIETPRMERSCLWNDW